ncbi:MAG: hypothetical protein J6P61_04370 [Erysipelotrichaceae bacterium]|nr:hypothetical protein [Erysipelotrichaceae bacterium]
MLALLLIAGSITLVIFIHQQIKSYSLKAVMIKSVVSFFFLATAIYGFYKQPTILGPFITLGLLCGLLGDIWLGLKHVFPMHDRLLTYAGFLSFGIGHLFYMTGMIMQFFHHESWLYLIVPFLLAIIASLINAFVLEKPMKLNYGKMKPTVIIYGILLFTMMLMSGCFSLMYHCRSLSLNIIFIGSILFTLSDLVLSGTYFGKGQHRPIDIIANYVLYYGGQYLIALSLLFIQ